MSIHKERLEADRDLAKQKFAYERQQAIFKRRFELAEQVLADAYRFRDMMLWVRNGFTISGEGETRQITMHETKKFESIRRAYFVPIERLQSNADFISAMMAKRTICHAHFGKNAENAYEEFQKAIHKVKIASSLLIEMVEDHDLSEDTRDLKNQLKKDIWAHKNVLDGNDEIKTVIDNAVTTVEDFCRPVLAWTDNP